MAASTDVILADAASVAQVVDAALSAGESAAPFVAQLLAILNAGKALTPEQRAALLQQEQSLRARLQTLPDHQT